MAQAALLADPIPRQLSFKHTVPVWTRRHQRGGSYDGVVMHGLPLLTAQPGPGCDPDAASRASASAGPRRSH